MKRIANLIDTDELCGYGCGQQAKYINGSGRLMCSSRHNACPANKLKNSAGLKAAHKKRFDETGSAAFYDYNSLSIEVKERMNHNKGKTALGYEPIKKRLSSWKQNYSKHQGNATPRGVASDPSKRWKRNKIPYIDSQGNWCVLDSIHEWQVANELDRHNISWIRPPRLKLADGRSYEPDFYLVEFDVYLDPKTKWGGKAASYQGYSDQNSQLKKIKQAETEHNVKILILWSSDRRSFTWHGIKEQLQIISRK